MTATLDDETAFLRSIADAPRDAAPRLVFADWLQDRGQDDRAGRLRRVAGAASLKALMSWQTVWREGFAKVLPLKGLKALRDALEADDVRLIQGATTTPPPLMCVQDWPAEAADALGFCGWHGEGVETVGEVEECFARYCFECDQILKEAAGCRWFLNWFDDTPRDEMRRELLPEVELAIEERERAST